MEAKEILSKVKQLFADLTAPAPLATDPVIPEAATPTEYELKDGSKVMIDTLEVGGIVTIDGSPAIAGDLELKDGTKITVGDNGAITAIDEVVETAPEADMNAKFTAFETLTATKFADYETKFSAYEQRFADYEVKMKKANKVIEQLLQLSQLIVEAPAVKADAAASTATGFKEETKKDYSILFN